MADLNKIIDELSKLTVVEAAELSKQLEEKWGVTAASAVAALTPTPKDDGWVKKAYKIVDLLALNVGKAKDKGDK